LLYAAQRNKLAIHEVPVRWVEDPDSRVALISTAREDLRGVMRLRAARRRRDPQPGRSVPRQAPRTHPGSSPSGLSRQPT
jgi:hypothetical protein